jgi:hypothetical protein
MAAPYTLQQTFQRTCATFVAPACRVDLWTCRHVDKATYRQVDLAQRDGPASLGCGAASLLPGDVPRDYTHCRAFGAFRPHPIRPAASAPRRMVSELAIA